jgi:Ca2+-transporting ATPase
MAIRPDHPDWRDVEGLTWAEAEARLKAEGYNELPGSHGRSTLAIALSVVREPMFMLLMAAAAIYFVLGDLGEAAVLLCSVLVMIGITVHQEQRTERVLDALRDLTSPRALVIRAGEQRRIPGREVVRGDMLVLSEGDRVPADATILAQRNLQVDESLLTGESVPVSKTAWNRSEARAAPGGDGRPFAYSGTVVVQGLAIAEVMATGPHSEIGRIGRALETLAPEATPLQQQSRRLVRVMATVGIALCFVLVVVYGLTRGDWIAAALAGITMAMAVMPEEIPVVLTVFMALGAWRISRRRVLTRRMPAIETLGAATVLCVDKTGTLTENRMAVHALVADGEVFRIPGDGDGAPLPETFHELLEFGILASDVDPFDPMEKAMRALGQRYLAETEHLHADWQLEHEYPLSNEMRAVSHAWRSTGGQEYVVAAKGAPEAIMDLCHLDAARVAELSRRTEELSAQGLRILGVAAARHQGRDWPTGQHDFDFRLLGLVALADPLRPAVPAAIAECRAAGIRVVMVTGDYPGTALAIAREAGLDSGEVMTGADIERLGEAELRARIARTGVFARVVPEQKLTLVNALKANGEVVAMTGDGVNDAPALKAAHIGVAMGGRGTDVAREAASLVLLDDDFASIVHAVHLGRRIYQNLRQALAYILAVHVPVAGMSLLSVFLGWPLMLFPVHVVFLEFIIDPACSVVFEAERAEPDAMRRPPRRPGEPLYTGRIVALSLLQGVGVLVACVAIYGAALDHSLAEGEARALAFATLVIGNIALIFTNRSWEHTIPASLGRPNRFLWWISGGALLCLALALGVPALRDIFRFAPVQGGWLLSATLAGLASIAWFEAFKLLRQRHRH